MFLPDDDLVRKCQSGGKQYFAELINRYTRLVFGVAYTLVRDYPAAEDITQETWLRAYEGLHKCTEPQGFSRWLVTITRNCAYEWLRRMKSRTVVNTELVNNLGALREQGSGSDCRCEFIRPDAYIGTDKSVSAKDDDLLRTLHEKMNELSDDQRVVLSLKHQKGMKCEEIAAALEVPLGTVTSLLSRAYRKLRGKLQGLSR